MFRSFKRGTSPDSQGYPDSPKGPGFAYACLATATFCWGLNAVFSKLAVGEISPMLLVMLRWLFVCCIVAAIARDEIKRDWPVLKAKWKYLFAMGALGYTGFTAFFYAAAYSTDALNIGILQGSVPVFVLAGTVLFLNGTVSRLQMAGISVTLVGVVIVASAGSPERLAALAFNLGDLLMIGACFLYSGYTVGLRKRPPVSAMSMFGIMAGAAFITSIPLAVGEYAVGMMQTPTAAGWVIVLLVTLLPSFLSQICFMKGVELIGPGRAGVFVNLVPVFAAALAVAILGEDFQLFHGLALAFVLGGIFIAERTKPADGSATNN